ncbi:unnamed protein product, partial [marine sediment metagenome]
GALFRRKGERKAGAGLGGAVLLIVLGLVAAGAIAAAWLVEVEEKERGGRGSGRKGPASEPAQAEDSHAGGKHGDEHSHFLRGRTTLAEAAAYAGVPVERLIAELKLPADTSPSDHFGRLGYRASKMDRVRAVVERLRKGGGPKLP